MDASIERLLRLVADYHNFCFCNDDNEESSAARDIDELNIAQLDNIAAASAVPQNGLENTNI